jgi:hypothetical protein
MAELIEYRGVRMTTVARDRLVDSQAKPHYTIAGRKYARVAYGSENPRWGAAPCRDCGAIKGELHAFLQCQYETCPVCGGGQLGACGCDLEETRDASDEGM